MNKKLSVIASIFVLLLGSVSFWLATDKWQAWTAESARRLAVTRSPITMPEFPVITSTQERINPGELSDQLILLEFIYTTCPTVCQLMGAEFALLQKKLIAQELDQFVSLYSITFDPKDTLDSLKKYGQRYQNKDPIWKLGKPADFTTLEIVKETLGLIVIPEPTVGFVHNTAVYVIYKGQVVAILDHDNHQEIQATLEQYVPSERHDI